MENEEEPAWHGYLYAVTLLVVCEVNSLIKNLYIYDALTISVRIRTSLMAAIYNKVGLLLPYSNIKDMKEKKFRLCIYNIYIYIYCCGPRPLL